MSNMNRNFIVAMLAASLAGCSAPDKPPQLNAANGQLSVRISKLEDELRHMTPTLAELKAEVSAQGDKFDDLTARLSVRLSKYASLSPRSDSGYAVIDAGLTKLTVNYVSVEPNAGGSRLTLRIGNPSSATLSGGRVYIRYGPKNEEGQGKFLAESPIQSFPPGAFTNISVPLSETKPEASATST
ncbi:MAG TPA: DUF3251 domain-containing protein [Dokdonella sp.]|nr:DUF3251 domain-containing protein [Dokdonella sp.]